MESTNNIRLLLKDFQEIELTNLQKESSKAGVTISPWMSDKKKKKICLSSNT